MSRVILILSCLAVLISSLTVTASATLVDPAVGDTFTSVDLFIDDYYYFTGTDIYGTNLSSFPVDYPKYLVNTTSAEFWWELSDIDDGMNTIVFTIQCAVRPYSVRLKYSYTGYRDANLIGSNGIYHTYSVPMYSGSAAILGVNCRWGSTSYNGDFVIRSMRGYYESAYMLTNASYRFATTEFTSDAGMEQTIRSYKSGQTLPFGVFHQKNQDEKSYLQYGELYLWLTSAQRKFQNIDSLEVYFWTYDDSPSVSLSRVDSTNTVLDIYPVELFQTVSASTPANSNDWNMYCYKVVADLKDVFIGDSSLQLHIQSQSIIVNPNWDTRIEIAIESVIVYPLIEEIPWYKRFWSWLSGGFDRIVDALNGSSDQSGAADQFQSEVDQAVGELDQMGSELNAVDKPDVNVSELVPTQILQGTHFLTYVNALNNFWDSPEIALILVTLGGMILISYLLFGEKG